MECTSAVSLNSAAACHDGRGQNAADFPDDYAPASTCLEIPRAFAGHLAVAVTYHDTIYTVTAASCRHSVCGASAERCGAANAGCAWTEN